MPLADPTTSREHYHSRRIECHGYRRADGLWEVEARMQDTKTYAFPNDWRGMIRPGEAVHDMWLRISFDDDYVIREASAATDDSPFRACSEIAPAYEKLVGLKIGAGFHRAVRERLGGPNGCTHISELLYPLATVAFQTSFAGPRKDAADAADAGAAEGDAPIPGKGKVNPFEDARSRQRREQNSRIDTCHALRADGEVARALWPETGERD